MKCDFCNKEIFDYRNRIHFDNEPELLIGKLFYCCSHCLNKLFDVENIDFTDGNTNCPRCKKEDYQYRFRIYSENGVGYFCEECCLFLTGFSSIDLCAFLSEMKNKNIQK